MPCAEHAYSNWTYEIWDGDLWKVTWKTKKHVQKSKPVSCFFKPAQCTSKKQAVLVVDQSDKTCAEIYSVLHAAQNNFSFDSSNENSLVYQKMFLHSRTAKFYEMGRAKLGYIINFDL